MQKKNRALLVGLAVVLVAGGGYLVQDHFRDDPGKKTKISLPEDPYDSGKDEPRKTRIHVDNSGPTVSVSVRDAKLPWTKGLDVTINGETTHLTRDASPEGGKCAPAVTAEPTSLLTRVSFPRSCIKDADQLDVTVAVDGAKPVKADAAESERPNVLMIMVDDMRTDELKWMPNVQKLIAKQGVNFVNGFASFPLCCPARASVMTGKYPHNHGVWSHSEPWGFPSFDDSSTFPVWIQKTGYHTTYLGKYLNGYGGMPEPGSQSGTSTQYVPPGWDQWRGSIDGGLPPSDPDDGGTYRYWSTTLNDNGNGYVSLRGKYQTNAYADLTEDVLKDSAAGDAPFFHYLSFTAPHHGGPHESDDPPDLKTPARPKRMWGAYDKLIKEAPGAEWHDPDQSDKPQRTKGHISKKKMQQVRNLARQRAEALYVVDQAIKRIMTGLKKTGELDNTTVVFTSDNGYFLGEQNIPQGKVLPYEPSLRVPVLMRGPGIPKGEIRTDPFLSIDYASTFADLADTAVPDDVDGRSMLDVARLGDESTTKAWSRVVLTETTPTNAATAKLAAKQPVGARSTKMMLGKVTGLRTGRYLYVEWQPEPGDPKSNIRQELYNVLTDPNEYENLAVEPGRKALLAEFHKTLVRARTCQGPACEFLLPENLR